MPPIPLFKVFMPAGVQARLQPVLESGRLACGPQVAAFEQQLAQWLGAPDAVALSDSTSALMLALYMAGVRPGDGSNCIHLGLRRHCHADRQSICAPGVVRCRSQHRHAGMPSTWRA